MQAGRELDALVDERVMGNDLSICANDDGEGFCSHCGYEMPAYRQRRAQQDGRKYVASRCQGKRYSTSIEAAWQVVEKFRRGCNGHVAACIVLQVSDYQSVDCQCEIYGPDIASVKAVADEMPLAICLAALKAVGVEVPHD